jgi:outer membrane protein assembly factor BamB
MTLRHLSLLLIGITTGLVPATAQTDLFVVTSDFSTGSAAILPASSDDAQVNLLTIHADAIGQYFDGRIYIVNRLGQDNVIVLDPANPTQPLAQFSVGNGTNPHQIYVVSPSKAYVTRYDDSHLLVVDPRDGAELGTVDLSEFADGDGLPEMAEMIGVDDRVYVSCQRLDRDNGWVSDASFLIAIDTVHDAVVDLDAVTPGAQGIRLSAPNPGSIVAAGRHIAAAVVAGFGDLEGGIDLIDPTSGRSLGLAVSEADLEGDISLLTMATATKGFAVVADASFINSVKPVNLETGAVGEPLRGLSGGFISTVVVDGDRVIVGDRGSVSDPTAAGLKIYDVETGVLIAGPIDTGLPPASVVPLRNVATAIVATSSVVPASSSLDAPYPNPFNATIQIPLQTTGGDLDVAIFNLLGQRLHTLTQAHLSAGAYHLSWDGLTDAGTSAASGPYLVLLRGHDIQLTQRIMLLK